MIYKFRIILDVEEDVFRDIEIEGNSSFEKLHHSIKQAFGFKGKEMASFYISDGDWNQGEEIALFNIDEENTDMRLMSKTLINQVTSDKNKKLIYVYDFLNMWTCYVELIKIDKKESGKTYPNLLFSHGKTPATSPHKQFEDKAFLDFDDNIADDTNSPNYDDFDFNENWN